MNKKILSIFLLAFLLAGFAVPVYADSDEVNIDIPETDPQVQAVNEAIDRIDLPAEDVSEEAVIEALEAEGINARADKFAYVFDFAGLEAALADEDVNIILLLADIQMERELTIDRDISMSGVMGAVITSAPDTFTITRPSTGETIYESGAFHFVINASDSVALTLSNVILDGADISGGIYIESVASSLHIKGASLKNCRNVYGAVTTQKSLILIPASRMPQASLESNGSYPDIILEDCIIADNAADRSGGGINIAIAASTTLKNCEIIRNSSENWGGGAYIDSPTYIEDSTISRNTAYSGGGLCTGPVFIRNSSITYNQATLGGGIRLYGDAELQNTDISFNTASSGGGIYTDPAYDRLYSIKGGTFEDNTAINGGAFYLNPYNFDWNGNIIQPGYVQLSDMMIMNNHADDNGGAIYITNSLLGHLTVDEDVIFSGNTADKGYYMTDEEDIAIHDAHVFTTHFSEPFTQYAYNNFDIAYTKGEEVPAVTASFYLRYSDAEPYETATVYAGQALGDKLPEGPEQSGLKFIGWSDINGVIHSIDTVITEDVSLYPAYILE